MSEIPLEAFESDKFGWPVRCVGGTRVCARPDCTGGPYDPETGAEPSHEFRIDGYCSISCRDTHEHEEEIARLRAELAEARRERARYGDSVASTILAAEQRAEAAERRAEAGWTQAALEAKRAEAAERRAERLETALRSLVLWHERCGTADVPRTALHIELESARAALRGDGGEL